MTGARAAGPLDALRATLLLAAAVAQILAGYLPILLDWPVTIAARSAELRTPLVPAGYAFAIWGPLFLWFLVLAVRQALPGERARLPRAGWLIALVFALNAAWEVYVPWRDLDWGSSLILLASLCLALGLGIALGDRLTAARDRWFLVYPLQALAGWLTAAFFANLSSTLVLAGLTSEGSTVSLLLLALLLVVAVAAALRMASYAYVLPAVWALIALVVSNLTWADNPLMAITAGLGAVLLLGLPLLRRGRRE